jgi:hypothetical protein
MLVKNVSVEHLQPDSANPRKPDQARMALLNLSVQKLGFVMPMYATKEGLVLSGHQRLTVAKARGIEQVPIIEVGIKPDDIRGINVLFNRATNDFTAFDTGKNTAGRMNYQEVIEAAEKLSDFEGEEWYALDCKPEAISRFGSGIAHRYDKKATVLATSLIRLGVRIPIVACADGSIVNGVHRLFAAKEAGEARWPVIRVPNNLGRVATNFLNYLSMDFHVGEEFADLLRFSAFRRPQNNRGVVPKAYRFWANGCRTLPDRDSYSPDYWRKFRDLHGQSLIDFGAGLGKVAPFLRTKGMHCLDFEPYRIDADNDKGSPDIALSKREASQFLADIADGRRFTSIFLASVLNSIPFPTDRMAVLALVNALSSPDTAIYGTCRDISDFNYEYGGIRNANYFVFDSEPGVRVGDVMRQPKIQKFHTQEEADAMFKRLWNKTEYWPGGNIFYFKLSSPKRINAVVLGKAIEIEFNLPYADGTRMGLVKAAKAAFGKRLAIRIP